MAEHKGKSPYKKYNKKPHKYSSLYNEWQAALTSGNAELARELARKHSMRYLSNDAAQLCKLDDLRTQIFIKQEAA